MMTNTLERRGPMDNDLPRMSSRQVQSGERWIYSAGFNVAWPLRDHVRINEEVEDLRQLAKAGASVAIVSHQGSFKDGTARPLDFLVQTLSEKIGRSVRYVSDCVGDQAVNAARTLAPGEVALFGNTRMHRGEEQNDPAFARALGELGDFVAVGGFSKAHRIHASNAGILAFRPGWLTTGMATEMDILRPWAGAACGRYSLAVIGGRKAEKVQIGLAGLCQTYERIIPGGVVLNLLLQALGVPVGGSDLGSQPQAGIATVRHVLAGAARTKIYIPARLIVAMRLGNGFGSCRTISTGEAIDAEEAIVDFEIEDAERSAAEQQITAGARLLVAGTPCCASAGFVQAAYAVQNIARKNPANAIFLGGDTLTDMTHAGPASSGGGSALTFLHCGRLPIEDAIARSHRQGARP